LQQNNNFLKRFFDNFKESANIREKESGNIVWVNLTYLNIHA